jgi:hypothetical protein
MPDMTTTPQQPIESIMFGYRFVQIAKAGPLDEIELSDSVKDVMF